MKLTEERYAEIFERAAKLLKRPGRWIKCRWGKNVRTGTPVPHGNLVPEEDGAYCAVGAIERVVGKSEYESTIVRAARDRMGKVMKRRHPDVTCDTIMGFNDLMGTTQHAVVKLFEGAACEARKAAAKEKRAKRAKE